MDLLYGEGQFNQPQFPTFKRLGSRGSRIQIIRIFREKAQSTYPTFKGLGSRGLVQGVQGYTSSGSSKGLVQGVQGYTSSGCLEEKLSFIHSQF